MDWKLELIVVPVVDVERAKTFYSRRGDKRGAKKQGIAAAFGENAVVEGLDFDERLWLIVSIRHWPRPHRWGAAGGAVLAMTKEWRRRWRSLDLGICGSFWRSMRPGGLCYSRPTVAAVPWARHGAGHTRDFDDQAAWLAVHVSKSPWWICCASRGGRWGPS